MTSPTSRIVTSVIDSGPDAPERGERPGDQSRSAETDLEMLRWLGGNRLDQLPGRALRGVGGDVGLGEDADEPLVVVQDAEALDGVLAHGAERFLERSVRGDPVHRALRELAAGGRGRVAALSERLHDDVAVGDHAPQAVVVATDRQR